MIKSLLLGPLFALGLAACDHGADAPASLPAGGGSTPPLATFTTNFDQAEATISQGGVWHRANNAWTDVSTAGGIAFGTNGAKDLFDDSYAILTGLGFGPDQQAQAVVFRSPSLVTNNNITHEMELLLRFSDDASNARGYECLFNYAGGVEIVRWNGPLGNFTSLTSGDLGRDLVSGDVIKATIVGNVISTFINGVLRAQTTDPTFASGQPGIGFFTRPLGVADNPNFGMTSYTVSSN